MARDVVSCDARQLADVTLQPIAHVVALTAEAGDALIDLSIANLRQPLRVYLIDSIASSEDVAPLLEPRTMVVSGDQNAWIWDGDLDPDRLRSSDDRPPLPAATGTGLTDGYCIEVGAAVRTEHHDQQSDPASISGMDSLITPPELADLLGLPAATLAQWRYLGRGPDYIKVGRHVRYRLTAVERWLDQQTIATDRTAPHGFRYGR